ncbi:hypothetical protein [Methylomonas sp. UP202]|uniref:hypothetical protein n=1 Tax=Methylomonas sp. UP202 TaxID=3040943 RepID=UPI00247ABEC0|nr:hypothetical protein [Methylomonas sp. UP202]WGS87771.1 hypothetical protein QC632_08415 [Methylomonas sp. UP202]
MQTKTLAGKTLDIVELLLQVNFNAAVLLVLISSALSMFGGAIYFEDNSDLYGPLANNLRLMMFYLSLVQIAVYSFYLYGNSPAAVAGLGVFLLLLTASLGFYASINQIEIDEKYAELFLYAGASHLVYGGLAAFRQERRGGSSASRGH